MPFVDNDGVRIFYEVEGKGPAVVFHTGAGGDSRIWQLAGYAAGLPEYTSVLIDQRGRGRSDRPTTIGPYRMELFASDVLKVVDTAGIEEFAFWGYSNGVLVGVAVGGLQPSRLRGLLGTGALRLRDLTDLPRPDPEKEVEEAIAQGGVAFEVDRRMSDEGDRFPDEIDRNVRAGDPRPYALSWLAWLDWKGPRSVLQHFSAPILMMTGEREDPNHVTEETVAAIPGARMVRIPGVGHLGAFARSDLSLPHARPFLEKAFAGPRYTQST